MKTDHLLIIRFSAQGEVAMLDTGYVVPKQ